MKSPEQFDPKNNPREPKYTPEQLEILASRTKSDSDLIMRGAKYVQSKDGKILLDVENPEMEITNEKTRIVRGKNEQERREKEREFKRIIEKLNKFNESIVKTIEDIRHAERHPSTWATGIDRFEKDIAYIKENENIKKPQDFTLLREIFSLRQFLNNENIGADFLDKFIQSIKSLDIDYIGLGGYRYNSDLDKGVGCLQTLIEDVENIIQEIKNKQKIHSENFEKKIEKQIQDF